MNTFDISAFGEILIDFTEMGSTEEGQKIFAQNAGGAPANVLVCATKLGLQTAFLGKVGDDMHGHFLRDTLVAENVGTEGLLVDADYFTTLAFVALSEAGERSFSFARKHGADIMMRPQDIDTDILQASKVFHIGSLSMTTELGRETTLYAIKAAKEAGAIISYDPNYRASLWKEEKEAVEAMRSLIPYADMMKISDEECELLTGECDPILAGKVLNNKGVPVVCITLGEAGTWISVKGTGMKVEGFKPDRVADTTGAGDSFWGAFLTASIQSGRTIQEVTLEEVANFARFANATASLCVEEHGAIRAMPTLQQVQERMQSIR